MTLAYLEDETTVEAPIIPLAKDIAGAAKFLTRTEGRYLVDYYYEMQGYRMRAANQVRAATESGEPNKLLVWVFENAHRSELKIKAAMDAWTNEQPVSLWAKSILGIGPILSAGLYAHIDIERAPNVEHIWRYAGLDPTSHWGKGQKRPWNADLKVLCFKIGESFVKVQNRESDFYGHVYAQRKAVEQTMNEMLMYESQAAAMLEAKNFGKDTAARAWYEKRMLPPAQIHARARRYAVKLFLSHWHHVAFVTRYGREPALPYILTRQEHTHFIPPPNWPLP